jgi:hypothetical protein
MKKILKHLDSFYKGRTLFPLIPSEIPADCYMVYILAISNEVVVIGHGKKNRAKVIFDSLEYSTPTHVKALKVRLYNLYSKFGTKRTKALIVCESKQEAYQIEKRLQSEFHGNSLQIASEIAAKLESDERLIHSSLAFIKLALCSYYDGLSDLKRWKKRGLIDEKSWNLITKILKLNSMK